MRPYKFSAGFISADAAAALTEMSRRLAGLQEIVVRPPLSIIRQGWNGQPIIYLDETANSSFFFAQLTSGTSPYSWKERIETAAGTWADGTLTGTSNAYQAVPSTGTPPTPATNDLVLMRASPSVSGVYEFVSLRSATTSGFSFLSSNHTLSSSSGTFDTVLTTPSIGPGTYLVWGSAVGVMNTDTPGDRIDGQLVYSTGGNLVFPILTVQASGIEVRGTGMSVANQITSSSSWTISLKAARVFSGTVTTSYIGGTLGSQAFSTSIAWLKVS